MTAPFWLSYMALIASECESEAEKLSALIAKLEAADKAADDLLQP